MDLNYINTQNKFSVNEQQFSMLCCLSRSIENKFFRLLCGTVVATTVLAGDAVKEDLDIFPMCIYI